MIGDVEVFRFERGCLMPHPVELSSRALGLFDAVSEEVLALLESLGEFPAHLPVLGNLRLQSCQPQRCPANEQHCQKNGRINPREAELIARLHRESSEFSMLQGITRMCTASTGW